LICLKSKKKVQSNTFLRFLRHEIATVTRADLGSFKAIVRRKGWPIASKVFDSLGGDMTQARASYLDDGTD
jgi:hypothetical protein